MGLEYYFDVFTVDPHMGKISSHLHAFESAGDLCSPSGAGPLDIRNLAGWFAIVQTIAGVTSFTALMLFFVKGGLWGPTNDALSVFWVLSLDPPARWFFLANRQVNLPLSAAATLLGIVSMIAFAALQFFLVVSLVRYEQTVDAIMTLAGVNGLWLIFNGLITRYLGLLPSGLTLVTLVAGIGLLLSAVGFILGGAQHPLAAAGYVTGLIAGFVWLVWLARIQFFEASGIFQ
jgi:hypothetical protein